MGDRIFFLLNMAQRSAFNFADSECEKHVGISVTQAGALLFIARNEGCLQKSLAIALGLNHPAAAGLAGRMIKNKLIESKPYPKDGRASCLFLSKTGKRKLPKIFPLISNLNAKLTDNFSKDEIATVVRFLNETMQPFD